MYYHSFIWQNRGECRGIWEVIGMATSEMTMVAMIFTLALYFLHANYSQRIRLRTHFCKRGFIFGRQFSLTGQERNMATQQWELVRK